MMTLLPITVRANKTFRGTFYFQPTDFDCSSSFARHAVAEGIADWNGKRMAVFIAEDIKRDIRADRRLMRCKTFSQLHDVVDANCLGGLCTDDERCGETHVDGCACHPVWVIDPSTEEQSGGRMVGPIDVIAEAQEIVHRWIRNKHKDEGNEPWCTCPSCGTRTARGALAKSLQRVASKDIDVDFEQREGVMCPKCSAPLDHLI